MTPLRVLIVDDEPPARRRLRRLLSDYPGVDVVGEAIDGPSAVTEARALHPDVVLLDIQMPEMSGLEVVRAIGWPQPSVIFVTAHDAHAIRAFELQALDYLLKPVTRARLAEALERVRPRVTPKSAPRLVVKAGGRVELVHPADIAWIETADNYVVLHCGARNHLVRETLGRFMTRLDSSRFIRVHRSAVVQVDRIARLAPRARGDWTVYLRDGRQLPLSRTYRAQALRRLEREPAVRQRSAATSGSRARSPARSSCRRASRRGGSGRCDARGLPGLRASARPSTK
jgi:two-component system, LytTR family, response regulator